MTTATVTLWGTTVGYISMDVQERFARFEYEPEFAGHGIELSPLTMPVKVGHIYRFTELHPRTFYGLPGLIADSLPDRYGNKLIDVWLAQTGRKPEEFNAVDRLCYTGSRGMGALEFEPSEGPEETKDKQLEVQELVKLASMAFASKETLDTKLSSDQGDQPLLDILSVGTSAGGARAKAVVAYDPQTQKIRSGQLQLPKGYEHWLIKFDGVEFNGDWGVADPAGFGLLEYSYYLTAKQVGLNMMECRLFQENGRSHFMTRRFDRDDEGGKNFVQTLGAVAHFDFWESGLYSYEQIFMTMRQLRISQESIEEMFHRAVFNVVGCNQDDHVKNFAFMMDRQGNWDISPAYDLCHSEGSRFTRNHQLSINGKTNDFTLADLKHLAEYAGLPRGREKLILTKTTEAFSEWPSIATDLGIPEPLQNHVQRTLRLSW
ncbi:MAG: serine/threonine-protein kinase HipA [Planctomycetota bacterium]|jgi:serine/threonine-protein kinase HipA